MALKVKNVKPVGPAIEGSVAKPIQPASNRKSFLVRLFGAGNETSRSGSGRRKQPKAAIASRGVYFDVFPNDAGKYAASDLSQKSQHTLESRSSVESVESGSWVSTNQLGYHRGIPRLVRRPQYNAFNEQDDEKLLNKILKKARSLPLDSGKYASNHIMINSERWKRSIPPLSRNRSMDTIAREHADLMAAANQLFHTEDPALLHERILCEAIEVEHTCGRIGENTVRGKTLSEIHDIMMASIAERNNILDKRYSVMGVGSARAENGTIYLCQIFSG